MRLKVGMAVAVLVLSSVVLGRPASADAGHSTSHQTSTPAAADAGGGTQSDNDTATQTTNQQTEQQQSTDQAQSDAPDQPVQAQSTCPGGRGQITGKRFVVNGTTTYTTLWDHLQPGDHVVAYFTIVDGCTDVHVRFISLQTQGPTYQAGTPQKVFSIDEGTFGPGSEHSLAIDVPMCYFQVDFSVFDNGQRNILATDTGGTQACTTTPPPPPPPPPPPDTGGQTVTPPPDTGGETVTPPPTEVGGETVTPPPTQVGGETVTPVVLPQTIERPVAAPAVVKHKAAVKHNAAVRNRKAAAVSPKVLARTGAGVQIELLIAGVLLVLGFGCLGLSRRRLQHLS